MKLEWIKKEIKIPDVGRDYDNKSGEPDPYIFYYEETHHTAYILHGLLAYKIIKSNSANDKSDIRYNLFLVGYDLHGEHGYTIMQVGVVHIESLKEAKKMAEEHYKILRKSFK